MKEWKEYNIGEICDTISDTYNGNASNVVLINTSDVLEGKCLNHTFVPNKDLRGQFKKQFKKNDILYSEIRPANKRYAFIDFEPTDYIASTKLMVIRSNDKVLPKFLYYILQSKEMIETLQFLAESRSGTFPQITFSELAIQTILLPEVKEQNKIVNFLEALDSKIELNRRINDNLEQQVQALFKAWFVDNAVIGDASVSDYFIPLRGKNLLTSDAKGGEVPVVAGGLTPSAYHNVANTKAPVITISASGANAGYVNLWGVPVWSADSSYIDSSVTPHIYFWYNLLKFNQKNIFDSQTGSAQPHIYPKHIGDIHIPDLDLDKVADYNKIVTPIYEHITNTQKINAQLAETRDTLLPKLMSGELKIDKVEI